MAAPIGELEMSGSFPFTAEGERTSQLTVMVLISSNHNSSSTCLDWHAPQRRAESNTTFHLFRWLSRATPCSCTVHKRKVGWSLTWSHPIADLLLDRNPSPVHPSTGFYPPLATTDAKPS